MIKPLLGAKAGSVRIVRGKEGALRVKVINIADMPLVQPVRVVQRKEAANAVHKQQVVHVNG